MVTDPQNVPEPVANKPDTAPLGAPPTSGLGERSSEPVGKRYVLEEQRRAFDNVNQASIALDQKLQSLLGSASLIIALVGVVQLTNLKQNGGWLFWSVLVVTISLYAIMVTVILWGLRPLTYLDPIDSNWDVLAMRYFDEPEDHVLEYLIGDYITFTGLNRDSNEQKTKALRAAIILYIVIIVILVVSIPFSLGS